MRSFPPSQILRQLRTLQPDHDPAFIARYIGAVGHEDRAPDEQSRLRFLGLKVPQLDRIARHIDRDGLTAAALLKLCRRAIYHEELTLLLALLSELDASRPLTLAELDRFITVIDNWATSDQLSSIVARALEREPGAAAQGRFRRWNQSRNPWMRRQSLVGLYYYARQRRRLPPVKFALAQIEACLDDPHFYVQRGVGWALRELHNVEPRLQEAFVQKHLSRISPVAWFATVENYSPARKAALAKKRRLLRKSSRSAPRAASGPKRRS